MGHLLNSLGPINNSVSPSMRVTSFNSVQYSKALSPITVTEFGIVRCVKLWQLKKAQYSISVTTLGIVTSFRLTQLLKAE